MRRLFTALALGALLVGCTGTDEERRDKRNVAVEIAIDRIQRFNEMGIDPIQLDEEALLAIDTATLAEGPTQPAPPLGMTTQVWIALSPIRNSRFAAHWSQSNGTSKRIRDMSALRPLSPQNRRSARSGSARPPARG